MNDSAHPTQDEVEFLNLSFNRFLDLFAEIMPDEFWDKPDYVRFSKTKDLFAVYSEVLKYPPDAMGHRSQQATELLRRREGSFYICQACSYALSVLRKMGRRLDKAVPGKSLFNSPSVHPQVPKRE